MSAPAGWYPQPDGTERFWDGSAWTEQIRAAAPPAGAVPPPPAGVGGESYTTPGAGYQQYPQAGQNPGYAQYPQSGQPAGPYAAPPQRSGMGRGCLIAAIIGAVVLVLGLGSCVVLANRAVNEVKDNLPSGLPSTLDELDKDHTVVVRITGSGKATVLWSTSSSDSGNKEVSLPFERTSTAKGLVAANVSTLGGEGASGSVGCEIEVDGTVVESDTADSATDSVSCFYVGTGNP
jgi:hypothetical protein